MLHFKPEEKTRRHLRITAALLMAATGAILATTVGGHALRLDMPIFSEPEGLRTVALTALLMLLSLTATALLLNTQPRLRYLAGGLSLIVLACGTLFLSDHFLQLRLEESLRLATPAADNSLSFIFLATALMSYSLSPRLLGRFAITSSFLAWLIPALSLTCFYFGAEALGGFLTDGQPDSATALTTALCFLLLSLALVLSQTQYGPTRILASPGCSGSHAGRRSGAGHS
ncbi:MAG: hypothetical protein HC902_11465 [Calothrix sp. SM1_5_4]|nr:hypothetical protein [Calothrix sp. SM1_5_4]